MINLVAQNNTNSIIEPFVFTSFKDYPNNKRVAYFNVVGISDSKERAHLQKALRNNRDVSRFYINIIKGSTNRCMIETKSSVDEILLKIMIDNIIVEYRKPKK